MKEMLRALWAYRHFISSSIRNDLRARFIRSRLGALWMIIHPLAQVLIFAIILSEVIAAKLPGIDNKYAYAIYLMAGSLCWALFSETLLKCTTLFIDNGNLLKKMAFPRLCLPVIAAGQMLVTNVLLLAAIFLVFSALGHLPGKQVAWLPLLMLLTLCFALSIGVLLGALNVFMRDIGQVVPVFMQALFWLTPVVYSIDILPEHVQGYFKLNPLYPLVSSYQNVLVFDKPPMFMELIGMTCATIVLGIVALVVFRRAAPEMVDAL